jgi:uncharacterized protein (TIGR03435 family)
VASIKPSKLGSVVQDARASFSPGRFEPLNITLSEVLDALNNHTGRMEGGPKWAQSDRYDIAAKADETIAPMEGQQAVLALLQERFKLAIHQEPRDKAGFALTIRKKAPPNLIAAKDEEATRVTSDAHKAVFQAVYMARFMNHPRQMLHTPVVDQTALSGRSDFSLDMDAAAEEISTVGPSPGGGPRFPDRVRFAVEQIGFRLQPGKLKLDMTVIDHAERPSEN